MSDDNQSLDPNLLSVPVSSKPRVSFSDAPSTDEESEEGETRGGKVNHGLSVEDDQGSVRSRKSNAGDDIIELSDIPIKMGRRRRVSVTPAGDAVIMRDVEKSYSVGHPVLCGYSMTVPCGSIYGLLGSSGCGKTTALSLIVGILKVDHGEIWLFGQKPGTRSIGIPGKNVGYMPQDTSMYEEFSISETLTYFGVLGGMTNGEIKRSMEFLQSLLDLPKMSKRVGLLSGGEQRRVSFAAALVHEPELLILDEPTVGVDPLLRQKIWDHLQKLVSNKRVTVILSTHYIEECRQADNIGILRNGRILAERQPQELMSEYGSANLERIVLALSRKETAKKFDPKELVRVLSIPMRDDDHDGPEVPMAKIAKAQQPKFQDSLTRIRALSGKNFSILLRSPLLLFFVLLIAAVLMLLICLTFGPDPEHMRFGLVNHELDYVSTCPNFTRIQGECNVENLSCHLLEKIPENSIDLMVFNSESDALSKVKDGSIWGYMSVPEGFSSALYERGASGIAGSDEMILNRSEVIIRLDESSKQISAAIKKSLYDAYEDFIAELLFDCGYDPRQGESPLTYKPPIFGTDDTDFREYIAPGATLALLFFFPIISTSIRYIKEKKSGTLNRSKVQGAQTWEIMVAYSISEFCILLGQTVLNYLVVTQLIGITVRGSHLLLLLFWLLSAYGGVAMGFLLGFVCNEAIEAAILAMAAFFPNFILSGLLWPVEGMPPGLQYIVRILPCTLSSESVRSITSRGWELWHPQVWPGLVILVGYVAGFFIVTILFNVMVRR